MSQHSMGIPKTLFKSNRAETLEYVNIWERERERERERETGWVCVPDTLSVWMYALLCMYVFYQNQSNMIK